MTMCPKCRKCGPIGWCTCEINFKTIHENKVLMTTLIESQPTLQEVLNNLEEYILKLDRYKDNANSGGQDCWFTMDLDEEGEWVKLEDILNLFRAKKL